MSTDKLTDVKTWMRLGYIVVFLIILYFIRLAVMLTSIGQFIYNLATGSLHKQAQEITLALCDYTHQVVKYLTFNSDKVPYPFGEDWPGQKTTKKS
ncbi:DUF4389 domain-containing protein [Gammaproteobacteria bacterium]|nr:DUF4389 domain-containing protein [Gammaproteobacteria bacterium]